MNNVNVLMCRICEKDHESRTALTTHMRQNHCACEMPYVCQLCNFRSSMYSDVVDHFKKVLVALLSFCLPSVQDLGRYTLGGSCEPSVCVWANLLLALISSGW